MTWARRVLLGAGAIVALTLVTFTGRSMVRNGEIVPRVTLSGVELGGLGRADAEEAVLRLEDELATSPVVVIVDGTSFTFDPVQVGFNLDLQATVDAAFDAGNGSGFERFADWFTRRSYQIEPIGSIDEEAVGLLITDWEESAITNLPFNGSVTVVDGTPVSEPPRNGTQVNRATAIPAITSMMLERTRRPVALELITKEPELTEADIREALRTAQALLDGPIVLESSGPPLSVTFRPADLARAFRATYVNEPTPRLDLAFDPVMVSERLAPLVSALEAPPQDAEIVITADDQVVIVPGTPGTLVDPDLVAAELKKAALLPERRAPLPYATGVEPEFSTADAEALGLVGKVSEFTTEHACCQPRVTNIQRMADLVDGALVLPGEDFSLNEHVGIRTVENGFVEAPMILRGEFVPSVGGGVSQFATTLFNAVFFGGYEDVFHQPHSYYFSRYPEGREATVSWPNPELIFRNDTDAAVLIHTEYTDESITVKLFGDNGGRVVTDELSPRRNVRGPATTYEADSGMEPGSEVVTSRGTNGWTITLTRIISYPDGTDTTESWDWTYRPQPRVVRVHPCDIPGGGVPCPTTTTVPTTTTSTTPPPSTTTSSTMPSTTTSSTMPSTTTSSTMPSTTTSSTMPSTTTSIAPTSTTSTSSTTTVP